MAEKKLPPVHPGEVLLEDFLKPLGISQNELARVMRVPVNRISEICNGRRGITADTALRLGRATGTSARFWLNLQSAYDLDMAEDLLGDRLEREVLPIHAAGG
jgi:antitoxin HigA-1